jgi:DNA-binding transcriptional MerR regulator
MSMNYSEAFKHKVISQLKANNYNVKYVASINNISINTVYKYAKQYGIVFPSRKINIINKTKFKHICRKCNFNIQEIHRQYGWSKETIRKRLKELDLYEWFKNNSKFIQNKKERNYFVKDKVKELYQIYGDKLTSTNISLMLDCDRSYISKMLKRLKDEKVST